MTDPFDWAGLSHEVGLKRVNRGLDSAAAYLRERIEAAFVERAQVTEAMKRSVDQRDTAIDSIRAALARAEAAEARVSELTAQLAEARAEIAALKPRETLEDVARREADLIALAEGYDSKTIRKMLAAGFLRGVQMQRDGGLPDE